MYGYKYAAADSVAVIRHIISILKVKTAVSSFFHIHSVQNYKCSFTAVFRCHSFCPLFKFDFTLCSCNELL